MSVWLRGRGLGPKCLAEKVKDHEQADERGHGENDRRHERQNSKQDNDVPGNGVNRNAVQMESGWSLAFGLVPTNPAEKTSTASRLQREIS